MSLGATPGGHAGGPRPEEGMEGHQEETRLFLLRLWLEAGPQAESEQDAGGPHKEAALQWQGQVHYIGRGEVHAFAGWDMLIGCLDAMLRRDGAERASARAKPTEE